jgi:NADH:ubiquinone oxidoreductase subunit E
MEYPLEKEVIQLHVCIQMRQGPNPESCDNSGSMGLLEQLKIEILQNDLDVDVIPSKCLRLCEYGPNVQFVQNEKKL